MGKSYLEALIEANYGWNFWSKWVLYLLLELIRTHPSVDFPRVPTSKGSLVLLSTVVSYSTTLLSDLLKYFLFIFFETNLPCMVASLFYEHLGGSWY